MLFYVGFQLIIFILSRFLLGLRFFLVDLLWFLYSVCGECQPQVQETRLLYGGRSASLARHTET